MIVRKIDPARESRKSGMASRRFALDLWRCYLISNLITGYSSAGTVFMTNLTRIAAICGLAAALAFSGGGAELWAAGVKAPPTHPPVMKPPLPLHIGDVTRALSPEESAWRDLLRLLDRSHYKKAQAKARSLEDPLAAKFVLWYRLTDRHSRVPFKAAADFVTSHPRWPSQRTIQMNAERRLGGGSRPEMSSAAVLAWFAERTAATPEGAIAHVTALMRSGQKTQAIEILRRYWIEIDFDRASEKTFRKSFSRFLQPDTELARLERLLLARKDGASRRQAARMKNGYPQLAKARLALAFRRGGVDAAIRKVPQHLQNDGGLIYERARWRYRKRLYAGVTELLDRPKLNPSHPELWWPIREWAARKALAKGDVARAYRYTSEHGLTQGIGFADGEWLSGWIALRDLKQPGTAYKHFAQLYEGVRSPISKARGAYWAGEAASLLPNPEWAQRWYGLAAQYGETFYGQLASRRLGASTIQIAASHSTPGKTLRERFFAGEEARLVRLLGRLGERKLQRKFVMRLLATATDSHDFYLAAALAKSVGRPELALKSAKAARKAGIRMPEYLFPDIYQPARQGPEPALVLAVIRQESAFNPGAISHAGARGLMQLMPATARLVAKKSRLRYSKSMLTQDPHYNMTLGRSYLEELLIRFKGSYLLTLAAYNAGPSRAKRWIKKNGDPRDPDVNPVYWIESIPISETRNYLQRVLEGLAVYREQNGNTQLTWIQLPSGPPS